MQSFFYINLGIIRLVLIMFRLVLLPVLLISVGVFAQSTESSLHLKDIEQQKNNTLAIKQLTQLLNQNELTPKQRINALLIKSRRYLSLNNFEQAIIASKQAHQLAKQTSQNNLKATADKLLGIITYYQGKYGQSLSFYQASLAYHQSKNFNHDTEEFVHNAIAQANLLNNIALVQTALGDASGALNSYQQAEPLYQRFGSETDKVDVQYNIATLYISLRRYDLAISLLKQTIEKRTALANGFGVASARADLGVAYKYSGKYQQALHHISSALAYFLQHKHTYKIAEQLHNTAEIYYDLRQIDKAQSLALKALEKSEEVGHQKAYAGSLQTLAKIHFHQGDLAQAFSYLEQSNIVGEKMGYQELLNENILLQALIYAAQGNTIQAVQMQLRYKNIRFAQANDQLNEQLARFESEKLKQLVASLKQSKKLVQLQTTKAKQQRYFIMLGVAFILVVLLLIYRHYLENRLTKDLEARVKQRTQALEFLTEELQQANLVKSQFLANMSHEIRTPLTAVIGQSEAIIHGDFEQGTLIKEVEVIHNNSLHLLQLINDILDLSKIEAEKFELEIRHYDLHQIIFELEDMFKKQAKQKRLAFTVSHHIPSPFIVKVDSLRLKQILINLCSNAIKFTDEGWVSLDIAIVDQALFFTVEDTGIGMSEAQMAKIFNSFTQADNSISRRFSGSGLGLFLSMQLAKVMTGQITVTSKVGQGSTFLFKLPIGEVYSSSTELSAEHYAKEVFSSEERFVGNILLADDHDDNRRLIARLLTSTGLDVIEAKNGKEALELCLQAQPSLVLLDIQMPEMDGLQALQKLRSLGFTTPVYALTANAMSHEIDQYLALGFTGHLKKPIERGIFLATIAQHYQRMNYSDSQLDNTIADIDMSDLQLEFKHSLRQDSLDISTFLVQQDYQNLARLVHKLAGAATMFGFVELSQSATALELVIKKKQYQSVSDLTDCLLDEIELLIN